MLRIVLLAFLLVATVPGVTSAESAESAEHWLERIVRFYERAPFAMDYSMQAQVFRGNDTTFLSADGAITYGDETHLRMTVRMTVLQSGQPSREAALLVVADGEEAWLETAGPADGVQVVQISADQLRKALAEAGPGGIEAGNPLARVRRLQELVDFEVTEESAERVVLRAPVSDRLREDLGPEAELLGPDAGVLIALDPATGAPLRLEIAGEGFRLETTFEGLRFLDAAAFTDGTFAYRPPEGASVVEPAPASGETLRMSGYFDTTGKVVVEPVYESRSNFSEGLAIVQIPGIEREGAIDPTGELVIEPKFRRLGTFSEGLASARLEGPYTGYVDESGQWVIEPRFDIAEAFSEGLAVVMTEGEFAWIDRSGEIVIGPRPYSLARSFSEGVAAFLSGDQLWGLIDAAGEVVVEPRYDRIRDAAEGMIAVKQGDAWGFVDVAGHPTIESRWDAVLDFSEGLAPVERRGRGWSYVDAGGEVVIEGPFEQAFPFREGLAAVKISGAWGFVDPRGRFVIEPRFAGAAWFSGGLAPVELDGEWGYVDPAGKIVVEPRFESAEPFSEGLARFSTSVPLSPLHSEVIEEARWVDEELLGLAPRKARQESLERVSSLERQLEILAPQEPGIDEFLARLGDAAERYGVGIEVERLGGVDHESTVESRLELDLTGSDEAIEEFMQRARYLRPLTKLHEPRRIGSGRVAVEASVYWRKPLVIPPLRTCRRFSHRLEASASPVERRAVDALEALCDEFDAREELRRLELRAKAAINQLNALTKLSRETRVAPPETSAEELEAFIEKLGSDGEDRERR